MTTRFNIFLGRTNLYRVELGTRPQTSMKIISETGDFGQLEMETFTREASVQSRNQT